eukprot:25388-Eustigmatos_ZCMA.PRE.1
MRQPGLIGQVSTTEKEQPYVWPYRSTASTKARGWAYEPLRRSLPRRRSTRNNRRTSDCHLALR